MPGRYRDINYSLRPAKAVERKMLCDAFRRLHPFAKVETYGYVGFGSLYFSDFQVFHRSLGIDDMLSIEKDANYKESFLFNKPYRCVDLDFRRACHVLPEIDWDRRIILWLDYEGKIDTEILSDIRTAFARASSGSLLLVSVNVQMDPEPEQAARRKYEEETKVSYSLDGYRLRQLRNRVGAALPGDVGGESLRGQRSIPTLCQSDLVGFDSLAIKLKESVDAVSKLIKMHLSEQTLAMLDAYKTQTEDAEFKRRLLEDLNGIIEGPTIYDPQLFNIAAMRIETQKLATQEPIGSDLVRLNRLLLEEAYPTELARHRHGMAGLTHRMITNAIRDTLSARNATKTALEKTEYHQLFHFLYNDNAKMLTVGGLVIQAKDLAKYNDCGFHELSYVRTGADPYEITVPCLTMKEIGYLNTQLPNDQTAEAPPPPFFTPNDFEDLQSFIAGLTQTPDPVSQLLLSKFREVTRTALANQNVDSDQTTALRALLAEDLDTIVKGEPIFEMERFASVNLRAETKVMLKQRLTGKCKARLNRQLLEDAYPAAISRHHLRLPGVSESDISSYAAIYRYFPTFAEAVFV